MSYIRQLFNATPPVTKNLIIINFIVWLFTQVCGQKLNLNLTQFAALHYFSASDFNPAQIITYMFMHDGFTHILFNMFTLFMFGITLERVLGSGKFLFYYISCGIGAALTQEFVWALTWHDTFTKILANLNHTDFATMSAIIDQAQAMGQDLPFLNSMLTVGASGAIFGILLAFGMIFPDMPLYIMFIPIPIKAKWMVIGYGVIELFIGLTQPGSTIAHFAHLGGMIFGFLIILYWKHKGAIDGRYY